MSVFVIVAILAFLIGVTWGYWALKLSLRGEGYEVVYNADRKPGKGRFVVHRRQG